MRIEEVWQDYTYPDGPAAGIPVPVMMQGVLGVQEGDQYRYVSHKINEFNGLAGLGMWTNEAKPMIPVSEPYKVRKKLLTKAEYDALTPEAQAAHVKNPYVDHMQKMGMLYIIAEEHLKMDGVEVQEATPTNLCPKVVERIAKMIREGGQA